MSNLIEASLGQWTLFEDNVLNVGFCYGTRTQGLEWHLLGIVQATYATRYCTSLYDTRYSTSYVWCKDNYSLNEITKEHPSSTKRHLGQSRFKVSHEPGYLT